MHSKSLLQTWSLARFSFSCCLSSAKNALPMTLGPAPSPASSIASAFATNSFSSASSSAVVAEAEVLRRLDQYATQRLCESLRARETTPDTIF